MISSTPFHPTHLRQPVQVLHILGIHPDKMNRQGYWVLRCPFHKEGNEKNPSLNLHTTNGHYRCHTCGAKGGDILSFYMKKTGKNFIRALNDLIIQS